MPWKYSPYKGARFTIVFWLEEDEEESCHVEDFLLELIGSGDSDAALLDRLLTDTANHGLPHNIQKFRFLKGRGTGLAEFKARGGARILCVVDRDSRRIVCTHGLPKKLEGKRFDRWQDRAQEVKEEYWIEATPEEGTDYVQ